MTNPRPFDVIFTADPMIIPKSLPTPDDIEGATEVLQTYHSSSRRTVRICDSYVAKYGEDVKSIEAYTMMFVAKHTDILVPRVFAIYQRPSEFGKETISTFIVMQNLAGRTLSLAWPVLTDTEKNDIAQKLSKDFIELRQLPAPGYFGNIEGGKLGDDIFWTSMENKSINGPFSTSGELFEGIIQRFILDGGEDLAQKAEFYRRILPRVLLGDNPIFTHADLQKKNIIILPDKKVAIIDWAAAGWYPVYWEYAIAMFAAADWKDDWHAYLAQILDEFPNEYLWLRDIRLNIMW